MPLPCWPTSRDSLTVWKRTAVSIVACGGDDDSGGGSGSDDDVDDGSGGDGGGGSVQMFGFVPPQEQLDLSKGIAASSFAHLL